MVTLKFYFRQDWWNEAACRGRHDLLNAFVPPEALTGTHRRRDRVPEELARLCDICPVSEQCYADGEQDRYAVRGGTTPEQRRRERRRRMDARAG